MGTSIFGINPRGQPGYGADALRLHEAEHRHGSTLQILSNLVRRSLREVESEEAREVLSSVNELIDTIVNLHKMCQDREPDLADLLRGMGREWQRLCNGHIRIEVDAEPGLDMVQSSQTVVVLIAQELVLNAIKHAFPGDRSGTIWIRLFSSGSASVTLEVEDDGVGASAGGMTCCDSSPHANTLVRDLAVALGGRLRRGKRSRGSGERVTVCLPV